MVNIPNPWLATALGLFAANLVFQYQLAKVSKENRAMLRMVLESEDIELDSVSFDIFGK
jgi:hypothetical protein